MIGCPRYLGFLAQLLLQGIPSIRIDDGGVLTLKDLALVPDTTSVNRVREDVIELPPRHEVSQSLNSGAPTWPVDAPFVKIAKTGPMSCGGICST